MMRGRGRGKGGSGMTRPQARDDDGKIITLPQSEGPPPVYPVRSFQLNSSNKEMTEEKRRTLIWIFWCD